LLEQVIPGVDQLAFLGFRNGACLVEIGLGLFDHGPGLENVAPALGEVLTLKSRVGVVREAHGVGTHVKLTDKLGSLVSVLRQVRRIPEGRCRILGHRGSIQELPTLETFECGSGGPLPTLLACGDGVCLRE
jgi:hypothetical protein